jgi:hypothetical protein
MRTPRFVKGSLPGPEFPSRGLIFNEEHPPIAHSDRIKPSSLLTPLSPIGCEHANLETLLA